MGIPHLYRWLVVACPSAVQHIPANAASAKLCGRLYVDFNSIVHMAAREKQDTEPAPAPDAGLEDLIVQASLDHLDHLVARLRPVRLVYVAVDGLPPRAKMHQQRARRHMAARGRDEHSWDTNAITPGTVFMASLSDALHAWCAARNAAAATCTYRCSDSSEPGEGEQKILMHIRAGDGPTVSAAADVISAPRNACTLVYGVDADLLLMCMLAPGQVREGLQVVREQELRKDMQMVSIARLARAMTQRMQHPHPHPQPGGRLGGPVEDALLRDFVALCMLLGNDFVPSLPGLRIRDGAPALLIDAYRRCAGDAMGGAAWLASPTRGDLDLRALSSVLAYVSSHGEAQRLAREEERCAGALSLGSSMAGGLRARYYVHAAFVGGAEPDVVHTACGHYLAGLVWSLAYFQQRCLSHDWFYPHLHAPTAHDLAAHLGTDPDGVGQRVWAEAQREAPQVVARVRAAAPGIWQLCMVLPRGSAGLVPCEILQQLLVSGSSAVAHCYPSTFGVDTFGRDREWEVQPMLPVIDVRLLAESLIQ